MHEITYLPEIECDIYPGFFDREWAVSVPDETGKRHGLRVNKPLIAEEDGKHYLGVGIVDVDYRKKRVLIELPHEADDGANRFWVPFTSFRREKNDHDSV